MANKSTSGACDHLVLVMILLMPLTCTSVGLKASSQREMDIEKHEKQNELIAKSIQMKNGDMIDCVDIYKQPAFEHPLLRNHNINMRPSFNTYVLERTNNSQHVGISFKQSCPTGTIPILKANGIKPIKFDGIVNDVPPKEGIKFARATMLRPRYEELIGASAALSVWTPFVQMGENSLALVGLNNEAHDVFISAGWAVWPAVLGDFKPRRITLVQVVVEGKIIQTCINLGCQGFVQTDPTFVLGGELASSEPDGQMSIIGIQIYKDVNQRRWWVLFNNIHVGYWTFEALNNFETAKDAVWVGSICSKGPSPQSLTHMGSGSFPDMGFGKAAHFGNMFYFREDGMGVPATGVETFATRPDCYSLQLYPQTGSNNAPMVLYGGSGGVNCF